MIHLIEQMFQSVITCILLIITFSSFLQHHFICVVITLHVYTSDNHNDMILSNEIHLIIVHRCSSYEDTVTQKYEISNDIVRIATKFYCVSSILVICLLALYFLLFLLHYIIAFIYIKTM